MDDISGPGLALLALMLICAGSMGLGYGIGHDVGAIRVHKGEWVVVTLPDGSTVVVENKKSGVAP